MGLGMITLATLLGFAAALCVALSGVSLLLALATLSAVGTLTGLTMIFARARCPANASRAISD